MVDEVALHQVGVLGVFGVEQGLCVHRVGPLLRRRRLVTDDAHQKNDAHQRRRGPRPPDHLGARTTYQNKNLDTAEIDVLLLVSSSWTPPLL